jgi:Ca2+-binding RTX toxin-like protein
MKGSIRLLLCAAGLAVGGVTSASAATLTSSGSQIQYNAAAAETNNLTISRSGANYVFADAGAPITPTAPCAAVTANTATCPAAGISEIVSFLNDLGDRGAVDASVSGVRLQISGGAGDDTLTGGENNEDALFGEAGQDTLSGRGGSDRIGGGDGNDTIDGGAGDEFFDGDAGNDVINGGPGSDRWSTLGLPDGADTFNGGPDRDTADYQSRVAPVNLSANGVADDGEAGEGDNIGADVESLQGGSGNDTIQLANAGGSSFGGDGNDVITGGAGTDDLSGGDGNDTLNGGDGNDSLFGSRGSDTVNGGGGDDEMESTFLDDEPDVYTGGTGNDRVGYAGASGPVTVTLDGVANDGVASEGDNVGVDVEDIVGSSFADTLTGNASPNDIDGGLGNDTINSLAGSDGINGGRGNDVIDGGAGVDALTGGAGADRIRSRDGSVDDVQCGSETDVALVDALDQLRACESVSTGVAVLTSVTRVRSGQVPLTVECPAAEGITCRGTVRLVAGSLLGTRSFVIPSGARRNVSVRLSATGRRIIRRKPATGVAVTTRFADAAGTAVSLKRTVTVRR